MKKLFTLVAIAGLGLSAIGCAGDTSAPPATPPATDTTPAPDTAAPAATDAPPAEEKK